MFKLRIFTKYARYGNIMRNGVLEVWSVKHFARPILNQPIRAKRGYT